jgi:pimeloyl-ACP methyl ester carboxylesterase
MLLVSAMLCTLRASAGAVPLPIEAKPAPESRLVPAPCPVPAAVGEVIDCFSLAVPENRARAAGKTISIPIVRYRSRSAKPGLPIVFLAGGPGASAIHQQLSGAHNPFVDDHDFILFQQRGGRFATPSLACPGWDAASEVIFRGNLRHDAAVAVQREAVAACARELESQGIDLDGYDTQAIVADLLDLQRALGSRIELLAISYGTRVALETIRASPLSIGAAVLDSVLPPDVRYDELATDNALRALDRVLDQCAIDPDCARAFPDLRARWGEALAGATRAPIAVTLKGTPVKLTGRNLIDAVANALQSGATIAKVPQLIDSIARGRLEAAVEILAANATPSSMTRGLRLSVWCRDEAPITDQQIVAANRARHPELDGWQTVTFDPEVCKAWPVAPSSPPHGPVISEVPVMIFSGEYDPITPPEWGRRVRATLANGYFIELAGSSHVAAENPCGGSISHAFFNDPGRLPNTSCAARAGPPVFARGP